MIQIGDTIKLLHFVILKRTDEMEWEEIRQQLVAQILGWA